MVRTRYPTYAYGPPVSETRLPAFAMQVTIRPMAIAQTRYATGAAAPSEPATIAGRRKIPPPIVMLMMPAASPNVPMALVSDSRSDGIARSLALLV